MIQCKGIGHISWEDNSMETEVQISVAFANLVYVAYLLIVKFSKKFFI